MFRKSNRTTVKPHARTEGLSVTVSGDETLVYDRERYVIHRLSAETATVWRLADGTRDLATLAGDAGLRNVDEVINRLTAMGLVQGEPVRKSRLTRRRVFAGAAGAAAAGTLIAPVAASSIGEGCDRSPGGASSPNAYCRKQCGSTTAVCVQYDIHNGKWRCRC